MPSPNPAKRTERSRDQEEAAATALLLRQMNVVPHCQSDEAAATALLLRQMNVVPHCQSDEALAELVPLIWYRKR